MKKVLFSLALLAGFMTVNAQTVIWSDDFNDEDISDWTLYDEDGDGYEWSAAQLVNGDTGEPIGTPIITSVSWSSIDGALNPDNWIVSPAIDLTSASGEITLKWSVFASDPLYNQENYGVYVATENSVDALVAAGELFTEFDIPAELEERILDLSDFAGETVYVAFRHYDVSDQFRLGIDDVSVEGGTMTVSDLNKNISSVYPNPVVDSFNVNLSSKFNANNVTVTVTDLAGRTVKTFGAASSYNVADLAAGVYVVKITDGQNTETKKIVKK